MKTYDITIIGFGITGMLVLAILKSNNIHNICIIDPYFDGGDLMRLWGDVISNTPLEKAINALQLINPNYVLPAQYNYDITKITPLYILVHIVKDFVRQYDFDRVETNVKKLIYNDIWNITNEDGSILQSKVIIACQGSEPKKLQCAIPSIPLQNALNKDILKKYIKPLDKVLLFGTAHSGTLILENLEKLKVQTTAIYKENAFLFASDGAYDGIKEEGERIARQILNNEYKYIDLVKLTNVEKIIKASKEASWVIYAMGFESRLIDAVVNEKPISLREYDSSTGMLKCPKAYGFGIAYPSLAPDKTHVDVGLFSFVEHIQKQIPNLKTYL